MKISICLFISILFAISCNTQSNTETTLKVEDKTEAKENPLSNKIASFYSLFEQLPKKEMTCDDFISKTSLGKDIVIEYINADVRDWTEAEWSETTYNVVMAEKTEDYYLMVIEKENPGTSQIYFNTYDQYGMRKSSILVCEDGPINEVKSRIGIDRSIFKMGNDGVTTYKLNSRGVYIKGN